MAGPWTSTRFPQFEEPIRRLTEQHRELEDEPLHLAVSYNSPRGPQDIFLFEVIGGSGGEGVSPDRDLFETVFEPTPVMPTEFAQRLHLILTNPREVETALAEGWPLAREVVDAVGAKEFKVLHQDEVGRRVMRRIRATARMREDAARG